MMRELELLERLVAFPTVSDQSNLDLICWAEDLLQSAGFETTRIQASEPGKFGLHATLGSRTHGGLCLSAHTDVVPAAGQVWTRDPFRLAREGERVFGRGTTDMKGFVACALAAAERAANTTMKRPFSIVLSYDEEIGCVGIREMLPEIRKLIGRPEIVIVGEPTSMQVATGHKGKASFTVTCLGEAGHSALAPRYRNAIHLAARFVDQTRILQEQVAAGIKDPAYDIPYSTFHVGQISGGRALNIVPDSATLKMEIRYLAQASIDELSKSLRDAAHRVCEAERCRDAISVDLTASYPGLDIDPDDQTVGELKRLLNRNSVTKVAFGTEAGFFSDLGLTTVVLGPGDMAENGHKPDESIAIAELQACTSAIDRLLQHFTA